MYFNLINLKGVRNESFILKFVPHSSNSPQKRAERKYKNRKLLFLEQNQ